MENNLTFYQHGAFLEGVQKAVDRANSNERVDRDDVVAAVVMGVITVEAYFNATVDQACRKCDPDDLSNDLRRYCQLMEKLDRRSLRDKLDFALLIINGEEIDWGAPPFQDLQHLISLRNDLVHHRPQESENVEDVSGGYLHHLSDKGLLNEDGAIVEFEGVQHGSMISLIQSAQVAEWALETVEQSINTLLGSVSEDSEFYDVFCSLSIHQFGPIC